MNTLACPNFRRPFIGVTKGPKTLSDPKFHVEFISDIGGGVALDAEALREHTCVCRRFCVV